MAKKDKNAQAERETASEAIAKKFKQRPGIYIGSVIVLILITITFIGGDFLSGGGFGGVGDDFVFGYYDKIPISWVAGNMFSQFYEQTRHAYQMQGINIDDFRTSAQIWRQAYEQTLVHVAVLNMLSKSNYTAPEKQVDRAVARLPHFDNNGNFSSTLYNQMPEARRRTLWRQTQDELAKIHFFSDFSRLRVPSGEAEFISNMVSPMRSFEMVSFSVDDYPESEYVLFAYENASLFSSIHLSRITVPGSEREARRVLASITDGVTNFEDAARANSHDGYADRGGDMGNRFIYELNNEIPNADNRNSIIRLRNGEISDIIEVANGWAFFRVESALQEADFDDIGVMERVRSYISGSERGRMEDWAIGQANIFIAEARESGFDTAASARNLDKQSFGPLPINFGGVDLFPAMEYFTIDGLTGQDLQNISRNETFWRIAFSAPINTPTEPLVQGSNVLVFIPVEQTDADETQIGYIEAMYSNWVMQMSEQTLSQYFLHNGKASDDQFFWDAYFRFLMPR